MRDLTLTLMHGAPGAGKTTWLEEHGLGGMALGFDTIRHALCPHVPTLDGAPSPLVTPELHRATITATITGVEARLRIGQSVILDNTSLAVKDQRSFRELAKKYGANCQIVLCQQGLSLAELLQRNSTRGSKKLEESVLTELFAKGEAANIAPGIETIGKDELLAQLEIRAADINSASRVLLVGDIHSHAEQLRAAVAAYDDPQAVWIFLGDLFDRGPDPYGVWRTIQTLQKTREAGGDVVLLRGNHDWHMERLVHKLGTGPAGSEASYTALHEHGVSDAKLRRFFAQMRSFFMFDFAGQRYFCSHGGVLTSLLHSRWDAQKDTYRLGDIPAHLFVYGVADRGASYRAKSTYRHVDVELATTQLEPAPRTGAAPESGRVLAPDIIQFHGHRNGDRRSHPQAPMAVRAVINLEGGVTEGGSMRVAELTAGTELRVHEFAATQQLSVTALMQELRASPLVRERQIGELGDGTPLLAYNFTRDAFTQQRWDLPSRSARGLFIAGERIVARGYEKFFNVGEPYGYSLQEVLDGPDFAGEVLVSHKANGFLGLFASVEGELLAFSKAGFTDYSAAALRMLKTALGEERTARLRLVLERFDCTLACEVIHHADPHIVREPEGDTTKPDRLLLLDCIKNQVDFTPCEEAVAAVLGIVEPDIVRVSRSTVPAGDATAAVIAKALASTTSEGIVLRGKSGAMAKVKAEHYRRMRRLRTLLGRKRMTLQGMWQQAPEFADWVREQGGLAAVRERYSIANLTGEEDLDSPRLFLDFLAAGQE